MKVSLIIAVYKDTKSLSLILETLKYQTYTNFEVIVAEDGSSQEMKEYIQNIDDLDVKHTTQEDIGVRKARSQNNAILASTGEYLIFIDGDCLLDSSFIFGHVTLANKNNVLSGRRLNLNQDLSNKIRNNKLKVINIEKNLLTKYLYLAFDKEVRFKQGLYINPKSIAYKLISKRDRTATILGCNFSCYKKDMLKINGFDESYGETAVSDDMDLDWRFRALGLKLKSCKNVANVFHLHHKAHDRGDASAQVNLMRQRESENKFICEVGLNVHL